jgi:HEPN domain-containing protein
MNDADDKKLMMMLDEAESDLEDALHLIKQSGSVSHDYCCYHLRQALEKYFEVLCLSLSKDKPRNSNIEEGRELDKMFEIFPSLEKNRQQIYNLCFFKLPPIRESYVDPESIERANNALKSLVAVRAIIYEILGKKCSQVEIPEIKPLVQEKKDEPAEQEHHASHEYEPVDNDSWTRERSQREDFHYSRSNYHRRERINDERDCRHQGKRFLFCQSCGVKIPRSSQTIRGKIPCPFCGHWLSENF